MFICTNQKESGENRPDLANFQRQTSKFQTTSNHSNPKF